MPTWDIVKYLLVFWSDVILPSNLQLCSTHSTQTLLYFFLIIWIWSFMPSILSQAFPAVSDVVTNTDIFQGIVSKLDISSLVARETNEGRGRPLLFSGSIEKTWREEGSPFFKLKRPAQTPDCSSRQERNNLLTDFKKSTKSRRVQSQKNHVAAGRRPVESSRFIKDGKKEKTGKVTCHQITTSELVLVCSTL